MLPPQLTSQADIFTLHAWLFKAGLSNRVASSHMWLFKSKLIKVKWNLKSYPLVARLPFQGLSSNMWLVPTVLDGARLEYFHYQN